MSGYARIDEREAGKQSKQAAVADGGLISVSVPSVAVHDRLLIHTLDQMPELQRIHLFLPGDL